MQQDPLAALGLLIRKFGDKIDGGWEIFIPQDKIMELGLHGQIQVEPIPARNGFKFKVFFNKVVEGTWSEHTDETSEGSGGPHQLAKADDQTPA